MMAVSRIDVLQKISEIQDEHCKYCRIKSSLTPNKVDKYCSKKCEIGKEIQEFGKLLDQDMRIRKKLRRVDDK